MDEPKRTEGIVPRTCTLHPLIVLAETMAHRDPCAGCNMDRELCKGRPKADPDTGHYRRPLRDPNTAAELRSRGGIDVTSIGDAYRKFLMPNGKEIVSTKSTLPNPNDPLGG